MKTAHLLHLGVESVDDKNMALGLYNSPGYPMSMLLPIAIKYSFSGSNNDRFRKSTKSIQKLCQSPWNSFTDQRYVGGLRSMKKIVFK